MPSYDADRRTTRIPVRLPRLRQWSSDRGQIFESASSPADAVDCCGSCTIDTPMTNTKRDNHRRGVNVRPSISTLNMAVVRILSWYVTWNVAASRLLTAIYCSVFCSVYSKAGIASFQLSLVNMAVVKDRKSVATVVFAGSVLEMS